jgi:hypothetical protein
MLMLIVQAFDLPGRRKFSVNEYSGLKNIWVNECLGLIKFHCIIRLMNIRVDKFSVDKFLGRRIFVVPNNSPVFIDVEAN